MPDCDSGPAKLKIGVAGPMTGSDAAFGAQLKNGAEQAVADINAAGGIMGQQIELVIGDDAGDPRQGVSVANDFLGDGVHFVVGHFNSGVTMPASEVYVENGILMITPGSTNPKITDRGLWNVFRICGRDDQQGGVAGTYIAEHLKGKKIAIAHDKTTYGKGLADETKKAHERARRQEVLYEGVERRREGLLRARLQGRRTPAPTSSTGAACTPRAASSCARCATRACRRSSCRATASRATSSRPSPARAPRAR